MAPDGRSATIRIEDRGLGMSDKRLAEANERLGVVGAGTPGRPGESTPVAATTAQMGLWVVGRLAARHGISVRLRALNHGVQAEISIPASLLGAPPARSYLDLARSVLRSSMTHLLGREEVAPAIGEWPDAGPDADRFRDRLARRAGSHMPEPLRLAAAPAHDAGNEDAVARADRAGSAGRTGRAGSTGRISGAG